MLFIKGFYFYDGHYKACTLYSVEILDSGCSNGNQETFFQSDGPIRSDLDHLKITGNYKKNDIVVNQFWMRWTLKRFPMLFLEEDAILTVIVKSSMKIKFYIFFETACCKIVKLQHYFWLDTCHRRIDMRHRLWSNCINKMATIWASWSKFIDKESLYTANIVHW